MSARGYNGTMKIHRGHNGTADTTGGTSRSVVSARGHNGTADTTGRNKRFIFVLVILSMQFHETNEL